MTIPEGLPAPAHNPFDGVLGHRSAAQRGQGFPGTSDDSRIVELERENNRLQMLVAELLIKNQELRKAH
ncbi:MAG: hypothetical protein M3Y50_06205 [Acidobacteriota bacterium]|nr:hypothetical protein [Acidobacteriota bacterium]